MNKLKQAILLAVLLMTQSAFAAEEASPGVNRFVRTPAVVETTETPLTQAQSNPAEKAAMESTPMETPVTANGTSGTVADKLIDRPMDTAPAVAAVAGAEMPSGEMPGVEKDAKPVAMSPAPVEKKEDKRTLDARVQALKKEVKSLNRDLFILEEELLFPSNTQVAIFLSIDVGAFFRLDSVQLKIDDKVVANHLYTKRELGALERGGVQRLYMGNVKSGEHELIATFRGPGPNNREYRRGTTVKFTKSSAAKFMELKILDASRKLQPEFVVKEWE